jgi:flavin-dependent dehydrogenase
MSRTSDHDVDFVIVGGGPSGISTALHLQSSAPHAKLVVLEAKAYPREKICAGGIGARAFRILERIGVEVDCPMVDLDAVALRFGGETIVTRDPGLGAVVRRVEFDHALAKVAMARGITVRDATPVTAIAVHDDHVAVETETGERYRAKAIVGADGVAGIVRRATGFPRGELRAQVVELDTEDLPTDLPRDTAFFDFSMRDLHGYAWDFPTIVGGKPLVCRGAYVIHNLGPDSPKQRIARYLAERGLDPANYRLKQFAERGFEPGAETAAHRVLLVGEAAGVDIATGEGIGQAIEFGYVAGPFLAQALANDDFRFSAWRSHLAGRHLGWQMRIRHTIYRAFYGAKRDRYERMLPNMTALFRVGVQDFAGKPLSKLAIARGAGQFLAALARERLRPED